MLKELISRDIEVKAFDKHVKGLEERYLEVIKGEFIMFIGLIKNEFIKLFSKAKLI